MIDRFLLQRLRDLPIEEVAQRLGLTVKQHKSLCPFHDDQHPSLSFSIQRNTYRCFVCGAHGGTIDLTMHLLGKDFTQACYWLADENCIPERPSQSPLKGEEMKQAQPLFDPVRYARLFEHPTLSPEACRFLYGERHIDPRVVSWCRLGSWRDRKGINWLQIPYYDVQGHLIGIQNRNLDNQSPRFRFPRGSRCNCYNLQVIHLLRQGEPLYITEGCSDCWAMLSSGRKAIAIPSASLLNTEALLQALAQLPPHVSTKLTLHMYPDRDLPGERLFLQLQALLPTLQHHQLPPGCKDFGEAWTQQLAPRITPSHAISS